MPQSSTNVPLSVKRSTRRLVSSTTYTSPFGPTATSRASSWSAVGSDEPHPLTNAPRAVNLLTPEPEVTYTDPSGPVASALLSNMEAPVKLRTRVPVVVYVLTD